MGWNEREGRYIEHELRLFLWKLCDTIVLLVVMKETKHYWEFCLLLPEYPGFVWNESKKGLRDIVVFQIGAL